MEETVEATLAGIVDVMWKLKSWLRRGSASILTTPGGDLTSNRVFIYKSRRPRWNFVLVGVEECLVGS
jgi:hypothetical protein